MKDMKDLLQPTTERQIAQQKYDTARGNLILMIGASLLNIILLWPVKTLCCFFLLPYRMLPLWPVFSVKIPWY